MSSITTTISKLKNLFKEWHTNNYDEMHNKTTTYIDEEITRIQSINTGTASDITNHVINIGKSLSKSIDGTTNITGLNDISNELNEKNNTSNIKNLGIISAGHESRITTIEQANYASQGYVDNKISQVKTGIEVIEIPTGNKNNLNDYTTFGFYKCTTTTNSNAIAINNPVKGDIFNLIVADIGENNIKQIILPIKTNTADGRVFTRSCFNGVWKDWQELYGKHNTIELPMEVTFENSQTTQTYKLLRVAE